jgi:hypothetical protein
MKKLTKSLNVKLLGIFLLIGCASHPISHKKNAPLVPKELKSTSKILVLTYMSNRESTLRVELLGITNIYHLKVTDTDVISSHLQKALKENVNAKIVSESILNSSPTFKNLDGKYKENSLLHNLNKGMLIFEKEDMPFVSQITQETKADAVVLLKLKFNINTMGDYITTLTGVVLDDQGQTIYSNEKSISFDFNNMPNDGELDASDAVGAMFLQIRHPKTKGLQPSMVENSRTVINDFFGDFATHFKISKKK